MSISAVRSVAVSVITAALLVSGLSPGAPLTAQAFTANPATVFINEIHYDNAGTDAGEFVEIAGPAGTSLAGWSIELYNGSGGARYDTDALSGSIPDQQSGYGTVSISYPSNGIQNGSPDGVALVNATTVVQFLSYEGSFTATSGTANGVTSTDIGVEETGGSSEPAGLSLRLSGTGTTYQDFAWQPPATATPGAVNGGQTFSGTGDAAPSVSSTDPAAGATDVDRAANIEISFSEPVDVSGAWYSISCDSGSYAATASGGPTTFTLDPEADFRAGENCTVTIDADGVTDRDGTPDNMASDYVFSFTAGGVEACTPGGAGVTRTYEIQGDGDASPLVGQTVTTQGVVTGDFETFSALAGFYIQDPVGDGSAATSDGLFIYNASRNDVSVGDSVAVTGEVVEFNGITELSDVSSITGCSEGAAVPTTPISLPEAENGDLEHNEGMHVSFAQELTISQNFFLGRYGQLTLSSGGRMYNPTNVYRPGTPEALALADENARRVIILDDGRSSQNPNPIPYIGEDDTNRAGDTITGLTGNVDYGLITSNSTTRDYRIQPTAPVVMDRENERMAEPEDVGGRLQVAAFNVLNYFNGDGLGGGFPTSRGADSEVEFERQRDKIIAAITAMDAEIVGLMEIENDATGGSAIEDLVDGLNAEAGAGTYDFIDTGIIGGDEIKVALIYQPARVTPLGDYDTLTRAEDPRFLDDRNRPPLAQTFTENGTDQVLTVVVNHLKSKGSDCDDLGDPDADDGQGNCNKTREAAAEAIVDWLAMDPTDSDDPDFMIIGDLNSYAREDPIVAFEEGGYINLNREFVGTDSYTYIFDGWSGNLDYALASESLVDQVTDVTEWHINTDEPSVIDYNTEFKTQDLYRPNVYRSSDHDPVIVGLDLFRSYPISKDECKKGGWRTFTDPTFRNQGQCVSWVNRQDRP